VYFLVSDRMTGRTSKCKEPTTSAPKTRTLQYAVLGAVCALVIGVYAWSARSGVLELSSSDAKDIRNVDEAVRCAERACELTTNSEAIFLDTLGMVYSEAGRFAEAVQASERGAALARAAANQEQAALIESRLKHYREGRAYHAIPEGAGL